MWVEGARIRVLGPQQGLELGWVAQAGSRVGVIPTLTTRGRKLGPQLCLRLQPPTHPQPGQHFADSGPAPFPLRAGEGSRGKQRQRSVWIAFERAWLNCSEMKDKGNGGTQSWNTSCHFAHRESGRKLR